MKLIHVCMERSPVGSPKMVDFLLGCLSNNQTRVPINNSDVYAHDHQCIFFLLHSSHCSELLAPSGTERKGATSQAFAAFSQEEHIRVDVLCVCHLNTNHLPRFRLIFKYNTINIGLLNSQNECGLLNKPCHLTETRPKD